jgi:hypothetical protein
VFRLDMTGAGNNDSAAVWIDNNRILNSNYPSALPLEGVVDMAGGSTHDIKIDYSEADGTAKAQLLWDTPCDVGVAYAVIPSAQFSPTGSGGAGGGTRAGGDNASGSNYYVWQLLNAMGDAQVQEITNQSVGRWGLAGTSMMIPSFSPDGTKLVFLNGDSSTGAGWRKGISMFDYDTNLNYFWNRRLIVSNWPSGDVMKWPTFETDSQSIIYQTSTPVETDSNNGNTPYGGVTPSNYFQVPGRLWSTNTAANPPVQVALNNINNGEQVMDQNKSYQPTMLPVAAAGYRWAVFTSTRPYGNRVNTTNNQSYANIAAYTAMTDKANHQSMLWVAAIDDVASAATDRSHPPFFLPNQNFAADPTQGYVNERGFWALSPCIPVGTGATSLCNVNEECCGGTGMAPTAICRVDTPITYPSTSHCAAKPAPNACAAEGAACVVNGDCCINDGLVCGGGICKKPPPIDISAYAPVNFERVYEGNCPVNFSPIWHFFDWQASAPPVGSYIEFYAQTAADPSQFVTLPEAPDPVTDPSVVYLGAAEPGDPTGWVGSDVAIKLAEKGIANQQYLKITMRFAPNTAQDASPVLTNWRQAHSCQPSQ